MFNTKFVFELETDIMKSKFECVYQTKELASRSIKIIVIIQVNLLPSFLLKSKINMTICAKESEKYNYIVI